VCQIRVALVDPQGSPAGGEVMISVPAGSWLQRSDILGAAGAGDRDLVYAIVEPSMACGPVWAYGSVVDNSTGDPTTIPVLVQ